MVEMIEVGELPGARRIDTVTAASVVLTINAALFLVIAVVGAPFLAYIFADDDTGKWNRMWPLVTWWFVAAGLGVACARVAMRSIGRRNYDIRRSGTGAALGTAAAITMLVVTSFERSPIVAAVGTLFVLANIGAAVALHNSSPAEEELEDDDELEHEELEDLAYAEPEAAEEAPARDTVDLSGLENRGPGRGAPAAARRRMRRRAALVTLTGVQMARRPRR
jgi:hypothetical protein